LVYGFSLSSQASHFVSRQLRSHQRLVDRIMRAISANETEVRDVLAAVTPGGGKSLLPVIAATRLIAARIVDRVVWIVPRETLKYQAEEAFADVSWRSALGHELSVRAADNEPDPSRGLAGYVTTYQAVAAAPDLHLAEFQRYRTLLVVDELHHLPALYDINPDGGEEEAAWSQALLPLFETSVVRLLMSGTLQRADGRAILWLPYRLLAHKNRQREIALDAPGWAVVGYSRRMALMERAILPCIFGAVDGEAEWIDADERVSGPHRISGSPDTARPALFTALRTEFADDLLRRAFKSCREHRQRRRQALGLLRHETAPGLGKLLVVAPNQALARRYLDRLRSWFPPAQAANQVGLAVSDVRNAHEILAAFRFLPEPSVLCTVAMAYEGMDAPGVTHIAALTHIRSRPWLEQLIARATRVDPHGGVYHEQQATIFHPDDWLFRDFRHQIETEQGTKASEKKRRRRQHELPFDGPEEIEANPFGIVPLRSNALAIRFEEVAPGPDFVAAPRAEQRDPGAAVETPSVAEHRLRQRIGQMVAAQVIEDESLPDRACRTASEYHAYNAVLRNCFGKPRAEMTLSELEAVISWLERHRLSDYLHVLEEDQHYRFSAARRGHAIPRTGRRS
jgi:superfamily II DNA or RNA helicase